MDLHIELIVLELYAAMMVHHGEKILLEPGAAIQAQLVVPIH